MSFRISHFRDTDFNDIDGTGVFNLDAIVLCDTVDDLPGRYDIAYHKLVLGCKANIICAVMVNGKKMNPAEVAVAEVEVMKRSLLTLWQNGIRSQVQQSQNMVLFTSTQTTIHKVE